MRHFLTPVLSLLFLTSCASQIPIPVNHPLSTQLKARSLHHWELLAADIARETKEALRRSGIDQEKPLYVAPPAGDSTFGTVFRKLLLTRLNAEKLAISETPEEAITLRYETDLVSHGSSRYTHIPGTATALTAGAWVIRDIAAGTSGAVPASLALGGAVDLAAGHYAGQPTATELLVTTSIHDGSTAIFRRSDIYYVEDADVSLFTSTQGNGDPLREFPVTCGTEPCTTPKAPR